MTQPTSLAPLRASLLAALAPALLVPLASASPQQSIEGNEEGSQLTGPEAAELLSGLSPQLLIDEPGDGRTWARGPGWKASFGPEGMTYIPFFGSNAPKNYPVKFDLSSATISSEPVALTPRKRQRNGEVVRLDRGSLEEVYHLTKDTVEQTFVFDELPYRGELVLDLTVTTELKSATNPSGGIVFSNELGEVRYGRALALDATGQVLELTQELTSSGIRIVVPADYVASAALPLVVDPILTTFSIATNVRRQLDVDVAYEGRNAAFQIVYSEIQSATDFDVVAVRYSPTLGVLFTPDAIDVSSALWNLPRNAAAYHEGQFLCAAVVGTATGSRRVWGRSQDSDSGDRGPQFQISGPGAERVDVGGKGNDINSSYDFMVVWQEADTLNQDFDIVAQAVNGNSGLTGGRIVIDGDVGDLDRAPAISKTSGRPIESNANNEYMIVWEREITSTNRNIRAQVIEYTGVMTGHNQFNAYTFSDSRNPDVSTRGTEYSYGFAPHWVLAFERLIGSDYDIFTVVARDGFADNARNVNTMQNLDLDLDHRGPVIAHDGQDYHIAYQTESANGDRALHVTTANIVHDDGELRTGLGIRRETLALSEGAPGSIGIASYRDGGASIPTAPPGDVLVAWTARESATGDSDVAAAIYEDREILTLGSQYCEAALNSTGASAWIAARGMNWGAGRDIFLDATEMPTQAFGHFLVSNTSGFVVNPGGSQGNLCLQGAVGRFNRPGEIMSSGAAGEFSLDVDTSVLPSPNGLVGVQPGETWYFQCWYRDIGPSSNFTNGVSMTFD
jgi:hypothetical protein